MVGVSRSRRAGLCFPVGRIHRHLKRRIPRKRIGGTAVVYLAAILEYLTHEVLDLAGEAVKMMNQRRMTPRHLQFAIRGDDELDALVRSVILYGSENDGAVAGFREVKESFISPT